MTEGKKPKLVYPLINSDKEFNGIINRHIEIFFRKKMIYSDRLLEALKYRTEDMMIIPPYGIWMAAIKLYPQLTNFLNTINFKFDNVKWDTWPKVEKDNAITDWLTSLNYFFQFNYDGEYSKIIPYNDKALKSYNEIKEKGILTVYDFLVQTLRHQPSGYLNSAIEFLYSGIHNGEMITSKFLGMDGRDKVIESHKYFQKYLNWAEEISVRLLAWQEENELVEENLFILFNEGNKIRLKPFAQFNVNQLANPLFLENRFWRARGNVFETYDTELENALPLLEDLINSKAKEIEFQRFFENHPQFLLLLGNYKKLHSQLILREDNGSNLIPDFFLEKIDSDFCDILDLKRPTADLVRLQKNRVRFRDCVMEAVAQINYYRNWFEDKRNRDLFRSTYGLNSFKPQVVVVIGRRQSYYNEVQRIKLESSLPRWITLTTYDDIIEKVNQWKNFTKSY
jgi:hypothetical protein